MASPTSVQEISLVRGDILYEEGDTNELAYVIESGEVVLFTQKDGQRFNIERRGPGAMIGELSILTGQPRTVSVEALEPCKIFQISGHQILNRFQRLDPVLRACIETSICFTNTLGEMRSRPSNEVQLAPSTLHNAAALIEQFRMETDLIQGLANGEFSPVYQPIVRIPDGAIVGFETLMRWEHPVLGNIPPDRFIAIAEATGNVGLITEFAIEQTSALLKKLRSSAPESGELYASINISGQDIGRHGFVDVFAHILDKNDLHPKHIKLEVTETAMIQDSESAAENLIRIRALGCGISIDDFGTGYSNLAYLKTLPLTALKIDRAFAGDAHANSVSKGIVKMLVTLGTDLDVDIIAEGLETCDDVETLSALGCRFAQGFYFHRPLAESVLTDLLRGSKRQRDLAVA